MTDLIPLGPLPPINVPWSGEDGRPSDVFAKYVSALDRLVRARASFNGQAATETNAAGVTLTTDEFLAGVLVRSGPAGAFSDTTPTAAQIVAAIPSVVAGSSRLIYIVNNGGGAATLLGGAGVTVTAGTIAAGSVGVRLVLVTSAVRGSETVTVSSVGTGVL